MASYRVQLALEFGFVGAYAGQGLFAALQSCLDDVFGSEQPGEEDYALILTHNCVFGLFVCLKA